jgi:hypothetical protein
MDYGLTTLPPVRGINIRHYPLFDTKEVEELYSQKDGVPVTYVCTTGRENDTYARDIFYRDTPHPKFGNKYFGLFHHRLDATLLINSADWVEDLTFDMIQSEGWYYYSSHRWDMVNTAVGFIDGGRAYTRVGGSIVPKYETFVVRNGQFVMASNE